MDMNIYEYISARKTYISEQKVKYFMYQLLKAIEHMHRNGIFHRDIKPENILLLGDLVKLADFGSCKGMFSEHPYTEYIPTRWYRPPECLLTDGYYDYKMDLWGVGCVFFEILSLFPLFPGKNELDQIHKIHNILGTPPPKVLDRFKKHATHMEFNFPQRLGTGVDKLIPHVSRECVDLIKLLLTYDPEERITASQALRHEYFRDLWELDMVKDFQSSLSSIKISPSSRKFNYSMIAGDNNSEKAHLSDSEKYAQTTVKTKDVRRKDKGGEGLKLNLRVEGLLKPKLNDTSTDEDGEGHRVILPPIKNPIFQMETKVKFYGIHSNKKKEADSNKRGVGNILKPNLSNQYLTKKAKKANALYQNPEYMIQGKKAYMILKDQQTGWQIQ
eukprot:TRINITY_DN7383_c0_g1_i2.p1 TRINITY_DN7383_c0_g1~~TRINITY_DN7383_c0_g1_i2.p1  ORF type:complete len:387 (-),score=57.90 TRINITY_DN7383_c0_g1_i2:195-1355(-)